MSMGAALSSSRGVHTSRRTHDVPQPSAAGTSAAAAQGPAGQSMDAQEVAKFEAMASEWWDPDGPNGALHTMNPLRTQFARDAICLAHGREARTVQPLRDLSVLDVGCGGGLFSEALARLGADVTGVDTSATAISVAATHAQADPAVASRTHYQNATAEQLQQQGAHFDAVVASEVIEHVSNVPEFCASLVALTRPGGSIVVSTINRTNRSYAVAIVGAEQIMGLLPKGTHQWERFITPEELQEHIERAGAERIGDSGMVMNPFTGHWTFSADKAVNYIMSFRKPAEQQRNP
ncbi:g12001 [Coccomyxa viridis]|uniref:Ubiquinone biosynthesis O-methyltransferase, mitochondrial n=1 Tax=Coccomyxa viridis TaxID=1274662 RepID=A0ABP1GAF0_9CHLO